MPRRSPITRPRKIVDTNASYMARLKFDPQLMTSWVARYLNNFRIVLLLLLTITLLGTFSYLNLPKRLNPEVKIPIVSVVTVMPGASPEDIESLVTIPLENELRNAQGLDEIVSVSQNNVSVITLQYVSTTDRDKAKDEAQTLVDSVTDLPEDVTTPKVAALDFEDQPIWTFTLSGQTDERSLMAFADHLENGIEELSKVDRVETSGYADREVVVQIKPEKINQFGINPLLLMQAVQKSVGSYPAGEVDTGRNSFSVTINPSIETVDQLRDLRINVQGEVVKLSDIATVAEQPKLKQAISYVAAHDRDGQRAVTFYVYKASSASIDEAGDQVAAYVETALAEQKGKFVLTTIENTSEQIQEQFSDLLKEFRSTIILVFVCLFLFLGLRQAIISSLTVPLTFLSAFIFMNMLGMSINFLSLFAFLLALGLLVDDTIVVVAAMTAYYKSGKFTPKETGLLVWRDTIVPIWSTTITTIWSFVPLLLSTGIIGEFIKPIPIVVTITMISSTAIAVLITLPIMIQILKPNVPRRVIVLLQVLAAVVGLGLLLRLSAGTPLFGLAVAVYVLVVILVRKKGRVILQSLRVASLKNPVVSWLGTQLNHYANHGVIDVEAFAEKYRRLVLRILPSKSARMKVIGAIVVYAIVSFALLPLGLVKNEFFPKSDYETFYVNVSYPAGTKLEVVEAESQTLLSQLKQVPEAEFVVAEVGKEFNEQGGRSNKSNAVVFSVHVGKKEHRQRDSIAIAQSVREQFKGYQQGELSVVELTGGPPAGSDLQIKLLGSDLNVLSSYANQVAEYLKSQPGITNVNISIKAGTTQLVFEPDLDRLAQANISPDAVGLWLRTYASGFTLESLNFDPSQPTEKQDIVLRLDSQADPAALSSLSITNMTGQAYPLNSLGKWVTKPNPTLITRESGKRTIAISAATTAGYSTSEQNKKLEEFADTLKLPAGYSWKTGGVNEENQKSVNSILQAMVVSAILILVTMVLQFGSFRQAFIVLIVIPLAVSSVFLIFALTGTPLSFPALIGVLSLFGIVVTNSMFIVDKINLNLREGMPLKEAVADAGASRLEPIILTKLATVLGLLPITIADPLWRGLGGAIISGLLISSTIMLLFIPTLYYSIYSSDKNLVR